MTGRLLGRARASDELAFRELTDPFRCELELHCCRILGSLQRLPPLQRTALVLRDVLGFSAGESVTIL
jgi:hypothetical protein